MQLIRSLVLSGCALAGVATAEPIPWRAPTPQERVLDAAAFEGFHEFIGGRLTDVQSVVVVLKGRIAYQYDRDADPEALRDTQSVAKTALAALVGAALQRGDLASLDRPVVELLPELRLVNPDPRSHGVSLRHLLAMTAGFAVDDAAGTARALAPAAAWARPMRSAAGASFAYDNSSVNLIAAILERATGMSLIDYAREQLAGPLGMTEPSYQGGLHLRTVDMAKLGHLFLQDGAWNGRVLLPPGFAGLTSKPHSRGGPPVQLPYGMSWWVPSSNTYFASGYGGQFVWVHAPSGAVVAVTSAVSPGSQQRGQAMRLIRGRLFDAMQRRVSSASEPRPPS